MRQTPNYNLPLIDPGDAFGPDSINKGMETLDATIKPLSDLVNKIKAAMGTDTAGNPVAVKIATGSYMGTGTYGADNPCSLTFPFAPKVVFYLGRCYAAANEWYGLAMENGCRYFNIVNAELLTTEYRAGFAFVDGERSATRVDNNMGRKSADGTQIQWYNRDTSSPIVQLNSMAYTYYFLAIA